MYTLCVYMHVSTNSCILDEPALIASIQATSEVIYISCFLSVAPEGLRPPTLSLLNATTVAVAWSAPEKPNDNITRYELTISRGENVYFTLDQGMNTSAILCNLQPFTNYSVRVTVYNTVGNTSATEYIQTGETGKYILQRCCCVHVSIHVHLHFILNSSIGI